VDPLKEIAKWVDACVDSLQRTCTRSSWTTTGAPSTTRCWEQQDLDEAYTLCDRDRQIDMAADSQLEAIGAGIGGGRTSALQILTDAQSGVRKRSQREALCSGVPLKALQR